MDEVELDFTFQDGANVPECVWAIVAKDELKEIKTRRWDLVRGGRMSVLLTRLVTQNFFFKLTLELCAYC